jgi:hypothetical protein
MWRHALGGEATRKKNDEKAVNPTNPRRGLTALIRSYETGFILFTEIEE